MAGDVGLAQIYGGGSGADQYVTQSQLGSLLDAWYAKKQPLQQSAAAPNTNTYTPAYSADTTQQAAGESTQQTPGAQPAPQQQDHGWRPRGYMGGMQTPFSGYGMGSPFGGGYGSYGIGGMGGYGGYSNFYSPFGGGMGYGQMYNPFSMY